MLTLVVSIQFNEISISWGKWNAYGVGGPQKFVTLQSPKRISIVITSITGT